MTRDARIAELEAQLAAADLAVATFIGELGYATGHGDTIADMLAEAKGQIEKQLAAAKADTQAAVEVEREACIADCRAERDRPRFSGESAQWSEGSINSARGVERRIRARSASPAIPAQEEG